MAISGRLCGWWRLWIVGWVICGVIVAVFESPGFAREPGWHTIKVGVALVCRQREDFDRIMTIRTSGDKAALDKILVTAVHAGLCTALHRGDEVYVEDAQV